jgi:hypothetical protein
MCNVYDFAHHSDDTCRLAVAAKLDDRGSAAAEDADLESSIEAAERVCQEV